MWSKSIGAAVGVATLALGTSGAHAHTLYEAKAKLYDLGYYSIRTERARRPYSFNACKRDVRYHIHINWYGDLVQVDAVGPCDDDGYRARYYDGRSSYDGYRIRRRDEY